MPGHQMIETCKGCPKYASCTAPCEEVEEQLPEDPKKIHGLRREIPFPEIDRFRKIDRGAIVRANKDQTTDLEAVIPETSDLAYRDYKLLDNYIDLRLLDKKQRRRFKAFLGCEKMTKIAAMAGCSKQNIQKQFATICRKIHKAIMKKRLLTHVITPHRFKMKYMELKPDTNP